MENRDTETINKTLLSVVEDHLQRIYPEQDNLDLARSAIEKMGLQADDAPCPLHQNKWSERDIWVTLTVTVSSARKRHHFRP